MNSGLSRRLARRSLGEGGRPCEGGSLTKADKDCRNETVRW